MDIIPYHMVIISQIIMIHNTQIMKNIFVKCINTPFEYTFVRVTAHAVVRFRFAGDFEPPG